MAFKPVLVTPAAQLVAGDQVRVQMLIDALADMLPLAEQYVMTLFDDEKREHEAKLDSAQTLLAVIQGAN